MPIDATITGYASNQVPEYPLCKNYMLNKKVRRIDAVMGIRVKGLLNFAANICHMKCYYCSISRLMVVIACLHLPDVPRKCTMSCSSVGCMSQMRDPTSHKFWACLKLLKELLYIYSAQILHIFSEPSMIKVAKHCDLDLSFAKLKSFFVSTEHFSMLITKLYMDWKLMLINYLL